MATCAGMKQILARANQETVYHAIGAGQVHIRQGTRLAAVAIGKCMVTNASFHIQKSVAVQEYNFRRKVQNRIIIR